MRLSSRVHLHELGVARGRVFSSSRRHIIISQCLRRVRGASFRGAEQCWLTARSSCVRFLRCSRRRRGRSLRRGRRAACVAQQAGRGWARAAGDTGRRRVGARARQGSLVCFVGPLTLPSVPYIAHLWRHAGAVRPRGSAGGHSAESRAGLGVRERGADKAPTQRQNCDHSSRPRGAHTLFCIQHVTWNEGACCLLLYMPRTAPLERASCELLSPHHLCLWCVSASRQHAAVAVAVERVLYSAHAVLMGSGPGGDLRGLMKAPAQGATKMTKRTPPSSE